MEESMNPFHAFLMEEHGVPKRLLPKLISISKNNLVPMMGGHNKKDKNKNFYICVCTSGHGIDVGQWKWFHSGWVMRVRGKHILFSKKKREIDIANITVFNNVFFVVSKRTQANESAQDRTDMLCVHANRKKLVRSTKNPETQRKCNGKIN